MPHKPFNKLIDLDVEEEEDEEDAALTAEEAQLRAARLEKELEEQNKFDCLCDGVNSALALVDSAFNGLLEIKDELLMHALPPSLLASLVLITGKMYRSITDLHTPVRELTRLVSVYSIPWEQKSEQLKKLHSDYESKQRQLNIAIRKLQLIDTAARRMEREKIVNNWQKMFAKVSAAKTHGRRWKFMIEAFKQKVKEGVIPGDTDVDDDYDDDDIEKSEDEDEEGQNEAATDKQRFMMSVITASPPQEEDTGSQPAGSDLGSDGDGIPSEVTESSEHAEERSPDLPLKPKRHGISFGPNERVHEEIIRPELKDIGVWTGEPEYETRLAIRVYRPLEMSDDGCRDLSCSLTLHNRTVRTGVLPDPKTTMESLPNSESVEEIMKQSKPSPSRRKSIGFTSKPHRPTQSPTKHKLVKPGGILKKKAQQDKKVEINEEKVHHVLDRTAYEEVIFPLQDSKEDMLNIAVLEAEKNSLVSMLMVAMSDINHKNLPVKYVHDDLEEKMMRDAIESQEADKGQTKGDVEIESIIFSSEPTFIDMPGLNGETDADSVIGKLPLVFYFIKKEVKKFVHKEASTENVKEAELVGVDMDEISKDDLVQVLGKEYRDVFTSAMSFASSSSHKSGYLTQEELEAIQEKHDKELHDIQADYEIKLQQLLLDLEQMRQTQSRLPGQMLDNVPQLIEGGVTLAEQQVSLSRREEVRFADEDQSEVSLLKRRRQCDRALPDWGSHLPKNVWIRMKLLTEEMIEKRHQLEERIQRQIAANIEKKLACQYRLQRPSNAPRGPLQDVSLPAVFMPSRNGNVYNPRAHMYFHPAGTSGSLRLSQPPSIFQLPPLPEKSHTSVVNLFELSQNFRKNSATDWLTRIAAMSQHTKGSRATTAARKASRVVTPNTPAPTTNIPAFNA